MKKIEAPTLCPECQSLVEWKNDIIYCVNENCSAKNQKLVENWAKVVKVKGLGPSSIQKLNISSLVDLYSLTKEEIEDALGSKIGFKIYTELELSKKAPLNVILPGFGIPLIGQSATDKICSHISHLDELSYEKARQAGLGPKASENLINWFNTKYLVEYKEILDLNFSSERRGSKPSSTKGIVCITGKLKSFKTKAEAEKVLLNNGYLVKSSLTKDVTILVNESGIESAKTEKARNNGIRVIDNITQLIGD